MDWRSKAKSAARIVGLCLAALCITAALLFTGASYSAYQDSQVWVITCHDGQQVSYKENTQGAPTFDDGLWEWTDAQGIETMTSHTCGAFNVTGRGGGVPPQEQLLRPSPGVQHVRTPLL
jgi:hypothetical protein